MTVHDWRVALAHALGDAAPRDRVLRRAVVLESVPSTQDVARDPVHRTRMAVVAGGRPGRTEVERVAVADGFSALRCQLHTGRTHQARVHLAHLGHPLLGEARYRDPPCDAHPRHALHARRIELADGRAITAPTCEASAASCSA